MRFRRGQAALEFLTTYGWALLIILVMISTISYFGIADPSRLLPGRCLSGTELSCEDYIIQEEQAKMLFTQTVGKTIYIQEVSCIYEENLIEATLTINTLPAGKGDSWSPRHVLEATCDLSEFGIDMFIGEKLKVKYIASYSLTPGGFTHQVDGELLTEVT